MPRLLRAASVLMRCIPSPGKSSAELLAQAREKLFLPNNGFTAPEGISVPFSLVGRLVGSLVSRAEEGTKGHIHLKCIYLLNITFKDKA